MVKTDGMTSGNASAPGLRPSKSALTILPAASPIAAKVVTRPPTTPIPTNVLYGP
jgi:hypothetical protein